MNDIQRWAGQFWRDGFLVLENFFKTGLMDRLDGQIVAHFGDCPEFLHQAEFLERAKTEVIPWSPQREGSAPAFDEIEREA
jgi:hypothetical protein